MLLGFGTGPRHGQLGCRLESLSVLLFVQVPVDHFPTMKALPSHFLPRLGVLVCEGVAVTSSSWPSCEDKYHISSPSRSLGRWAAAQLV